MQIIIEIFGYIKNNAYLCNGYMGTVYIILFSKGGVIMCLLNEIKTFVKGGVRTLNDARNRRYDIQTEGVAQMRQEIFEGVSSRADDIKALQLDRKNINADIRTAFGKIVVKYGKTAD